MLKYIRLFAALCALIYSHGAFVNCALAADSPILVVDMNRVFLESISGKAASANVEAEKKKRGQVVMKMEEDLKKLDDAIQKQSAILSPTAMNEKREQFEKKRVEYGRLAQDAQREMLKYQQAELGKVLKQIDEIVKEIAEERSSRFVLDYDKRMVLYAKESIDLTDDLIEALDERSIDN